MIEVGLKVYGKENNENEKHNKICKIEKNNIKE
jgi:hypothetical protein